MIFYIVDIAASRQKDISGLSLNFADIRSSPANRGTMTTVSTSGNSLTSERKRLYC
jgi:hypothetical protein